MGILFSRNDTENQPRRDCTASSKAYSPYYDRTINTSSSYKGVQSKCNSGRSSSQPARSCSGGTTTYSWESRYYTPENIGSSSTSRTAPTTSQTQNLKLFEKQNVHSQRSNTPNVDDFEPFLKFCQTQQISSQNTLPYEGVQERQYVNAYYKVFHSAILSEAKEEAGSTQKRANTLTKEQMKESGLALFDLEVLYEDILYRDSVFKLSPQGGGKLPPHKFSTGDIVLLTHKYSGKEILPCQGSVVDVSSKFLKIALPMNTSKRIKGCGWQLAIGGNTNITHNRCIEALRKIKALSFIEPKTGAFLRSLIGVPSRPKSLQELASQPPRWLQSSAAKQRLKIALNQAQNSSKRLNSSQITAIQEALQGTLTLWQGPPGTGKTHTVCAYISIAVKILPPGSQILVMASSNTAVDNIVKGLTKSGVDVVWMGQSSKASEATAKVTLDAQVARSELGKQAAALRKKSLKMGDQERNDILKQASRLEGRACTKILMEVPVVACTCISAGNRKLDMKTFLIGVLDEATQTTEPQSLIGFLHNVESAVLVGDGQQLPPTVKSKNAVALGLNVSLFERLQALKLQPLLLDTQYRMHPMIAEFSSSAFYDGKLFTGIGAADRPAVKGVAWVNQKKPVLFINENGREQLNQSGQTQSHRNDHQAKVVLKTVLSIINTDNSLMPKDIGIITPYSAQVQHIEQILSREGKVLKGIKVASVDGFQGSEKEVIVFSTVRSNEERNVGFLSDHRRLNVALTRAKRGLIVIGNKRTLCADETWKAWFSWVEKHGLEAKK